MTSTAKTASTTSIFYRAGAALRALFIDDASNAPETFALLDPRRGVVGIYATPEQAQDARRLLTVTGRQRAIICDRDGNCLCR